MKTFGGINVWPSAFPSVFSETNVPEVRSRIEMPKCFVGGILDIMLLVSHWTKVSANFRLYDSITPLVSECVELLWFKSAQSTYQYPKLPVARVVVFDIFLSLPTCWCMRFCLRASIKIILQWVGKLFDLNFNDAEAEVLCAEVSKVPYRLCKNAQGRFVLTNTLRNDAFRFFSRTRGGLPTSLLQAAGKQ